MQPLRINVPPPIETGVHPRLSFAPFIQYLQQQKQAAPPAAGVTIIYEYLLAKFTPFLSLLQPAGEVVLTKPLEELFTLIKFSILPLIHQGEEVPYAIGLPCQPLVLFHYSDTFKQLTNQPEQLFSYSDAATIREDSLRAFYRLILNQCYHLPISRSSNPFVTFNKTLAGFTRYYRMQLDFRFIDPNPSGELPALREEWVAFAQNELRTPDELPVTLPLEQFTFDGFAFFLIEDITEEVTVQELKEVFVHLSSEVESKIYVRFEKALRNLCGQPDLQIGIMPFLQVNGRYVHHTTYTARSIFLNQCNWHLDEKNAPQVQQVICDLVSNPEPRIMKDLAKASEPEHQILYQSGFRSFIMYPLVISNQALGMLEIGSPYAGALTGEVLRKIEQAVPLVVELLLYQRNQFRVRMEEIIRQKFTLLQPALEWKFTEAAWAYLQKENEAAQEDASTQVFFEQVHPFYGAIDVRNSSVERNAALQQDLTQQFQFLEELLSLPGLPTTEAEVKLLSEKIRYWQSRLTQVISPEEEAQISSLLQQQVHPFLQSGASPSAKAAKQLESYFENTAPDTGLFNQAFRAYEQSLQQINTTVNNYMEQEAKKLQSIYPHYFEKFRTDGLEYNLYVGAAIAPWLAFNPEHLQQFRNWQLTSMLQMAQLTHQLLPSLALPLQTTQLILAHTHPVDIKFRLDEHRFDVEGSYSIRYEVIKKRLDKAYLKNTNERLTQPDTIALVYTSRQEIEDYLPAIQQLQQQNKIGPNQSYLELEPLQGVTGLKALRLSIVY